MTTVSNYVNCEYLIKCTICKHSEKITYTMFEELENVKNEDFKKYKGDKNEN
jgi:hypothetical protein